MSGVVLWLAVLSIVSVVGGIANLVRLTIAADRREQSKRAHQSRMSVPAV